MRDHGGPIHRRGQIRDESIEQRLDTDIAERRSRQHRRADARERAATQRRGERGGIDRLLGEPQLSQGFVTIGDGGHEFSARFRVRRAIRVVPGTHARHTGIVEIPVALANQVDEARHVLAFDDRTRDDPRIRTELVAHLTDDRVEIGARAIHLVDECHQRHAMTTRPVPDGFGLRLHTGHAGEDGDRAIEHAQRTLDFDREVDVSRRVDEGQAMWLSAFRRPVGAHGRGADRDATFALEFHVVGGGRAVVHLTGAMDRAGLVKQALGERGLARVDVRDDAEVAPTADGNAGFAGTHG